MPQLMQRQAFFNILQIFLTGRGIKLFIFAVWIGLSFSMAVILSTIGLMDGFEHALKMGLRKASGDISIYSRDGFFSLKDPELEKSLKAQGTGPSTGLIQTEGFLIHEELSKGVVILGVDSASFNQVTGLSLKLTGLEILLGKDLVQEMDLKKGDRVTLTFADGNKNFSALPLLKEFVFQGAVDHGIYSKDSRYAYIPIDQLQSVLNVGKNVNLLALNVSAKKHPQQSVDQQIMNKILDLADQLSHELGMVYKVRPFWQEYAPLLEAVKIEKFTIGLILQMVVLVSIFNVVAFILFVHRKRAKKLFLVRALGVSLKNLFWVWFLFLFGLWLCSCGGAYLFCLLFDFLLQHWGLLKLPSDIYSLAQLRLRLSASEYVFVFLLTWVWLMGLVLLLMRRMRKRSLLTNLREEFN